MSTLRLVAAGTVVALAMGVMPLGVAAQSEDDSAHTTSEQAEPTYVAPVPVTGTMNADAEGIDWGPADDVTQEFDRRTKRGGGGTEVFEMDDPRLSGVAYELNNVDQIGPKYENHEGETFTGTIELVNDEGSWVGSLRGYATMGPAMRHWHFELTGTGDYEGLSAILEGVGPYGSAEVQGLLYPGSLPEYPDPVEVPAE